MNKCIGIFVLIIFSFVLTLGIVHAEEATMQELQTDVSNAKSKAEKNASDIESLKGGLPALEERVSAIEKSLSSEILNELCVYLETLANENPHNVIPAWHLCYDCGNGIVEPFEKCDDGNANDSDACHNNCQINWSNQCVIDCYDIYSDSIAVCDTNFQSGVTECENLHQQGSPEFEECVTPYFEAWTICTNDATETRVGCLEECE